MTNERKRPWAADGDIFTATDDFDNWRRWLLEREAEHDSWIAKAIGPGKDLIALYEIMCRLADGGEQPNE